MLLTLATKTILNTKINEVKTEIPSISGLATISAKYQMLAVLLKKLTMTQKLMKLKRNLLIINTINILLLQNLIN